MPLVAYGNEKGLPKVSQFAGEAKPGDYQVTEEIVEAKEFAWDFSRESEDVYRYDQKIRTLHSFGAVADGREELKPDQMDATTSGALAIHSKGDGTAKLTIKDLVIKMSMGDGDPPMEQKAPPVALQGLKERPDPDGPLNIDDQMIEFLFPLPHKAISPGETVERPASRQFNSMGSDLKVTGTVKIKLNRYVKIKGRRCAEFHAQLDVLKLENTEELKGKHVCRTVGDSVYYFDIDQRSLVESTAAVLIAIEIESPAPKVAAPKKGEKAKLPERTRISMVSDNLIQIRQPKPQDQ